MSGSRQQVGKRARFEVFKRDAFTCQYCGAQPPDVVLVVDHIHPVAKGGDNDPGNLVTACEPCNQGKADRTLGDAIVRPDADVMYLQTQQEIGELRRYKAALERREELTDRVVAMLQGVWVADAGTDWHPADHILRSMLNRYGPFTVEEALRDVAAKVSGGYLSAHGDEWVRYLHGVARNLASEE